MMIVLVHGEGNEDSRIAALIKPTLPGTPGLWGHYNQQLLGRSDTNIWGRKTVNQLWFFKVSIFTLRSDTNTWDHKIDNQLWLLQVYFHFLSHIFFLIGINF